MPIYTEAYFTFNDDKVPRNWNAAFHCTNTHLVGCNRSFFRVLNFIEWIYLLILRQSDTSIGSMQIVQRYFNVGKLYPKRLCRMERKLFLTYFPSTWIISFYTALLHLDRSITVTYLVVTYIPSTWIINVYTALLYLDCSITVTYLEVKKMQKFLDVLSLSFNTCKLKLPSTWHCIFYTSRWYLSNVAIWLHLNINPSQQYHSQTGNHGPPPSSWRLVFFHSTPNLFHHHVCKTSQLKRYE